MPTLLEETDIKLDFTDLLDRVPVSLKPPSRPAGYHQSGILYAVGRTIPSVAKHLSPEGKFEEEYPLIWACGQMWEEFCVSLYPEIEHQPEIDGVRALKKNDIWRSADGVVSINSLARRLRKFNRLEEFKFTYAKVKTGAEFMDDWLKMHQGRGYCSGYGPDICRWHVLYVRGDYKVFGPVYRRFLIQFTRKEIEQTETMLVKNRHMAKPEEGVAA